jgi:hypothetical protein
MDDRRVQMLGGLAVVVAGVLLAIVLPHRPGLRRIGSGVIGGGGAIVFQALFGPQERARRQAVARVLLLGLVAIAVGYLLLVWLTARHSTGRYIGDGIALCALVALIAVVGRMAGRRRA